MRLHLILFICLTFAFSCKEDSGSFLGNDAGSKTTVEGRVTERGHSEVVAYSQVNLRSLPKGANMALYRTDTAIFADANGNYSFSFDADNERDYNVLPRHELYDNHQSYKNISSGRKNKIDLELDAWGWVRVHIINEPPLDTVSYVNFNGFQNPPIGVFGAFCRDTFVIGKVLGNKADYLMTFWKYNRIDKIEQKIRIDYYAPAHDTVDYYFTY